MAGKKKKPISRSSARLVVRRLKKSDYAGVVRLHMRCFPDLEPWTKAQFEAQIARFPEGQIGILLDRTLVATSSSLIVDTDELGREHTFKDASGGGMLENHEPEGDALYGIDIAVDPDHRGLRLARRLYDARKDLAIGLGLRWILIGGRMPRYHKYADSMKPEAYVRAVLDKEIRDPVITAQVSNGFTVRAVLRNYLPSDRESRGCAVLMEWRNPSFVPSGARRSASGKVRVAVSQYRMRPIGDWESFAKQCEFFVDTAGEYRCDFLLFPELLTNQLLALVPGERPAEVARALDEFTTPYLDLFTNLAIRFDVNIIAGSHLTVEDGTLYNIAYLFRRDGSVDKQYKLHITPSEARWWGVNAGDRLNVMDTDCGKIALLICYDVEFPELGRMATAQGARIFFVPYNTDLRQGHLRVRYCAQARAIENHVYVVTAGAVGNLPQVPGADIHYAESAILTPSDIHFARDGIEASTTPNTETMLVHELDLGVLRRTRRTGTVRTWLDRRTDLYRVSWRDGDDEQGV